MEERASRNQVRGYDSQWALMRDLFAWLDLQLYFYYQHHQWLGPSNDLRNMLGLVVTREEFEHNLLKAAQLGLYGQLEPQETAQLAAARETIGRRLAVTECPLPLLQLFERFDLDEFGKSCVILAYAASLDQKYEKLLGYLQDDITKKAPMPALAVQLFLPQGRTIEEYRSRFARRDVFCSLFEPESLRNGQLVLEPVVGEYLSTGTVAPQQGIRLVDGAVEPPPHPMLVGTRQAMQLARLYGEPGACTICIQGQEGMGKRFQVQHLMARQKEKCVFVSAGGDRAREQIRLGVLAARLTGACLCVRDLETTDETGALQPVAEERLGWIREHHPWHEKLILLTEKPVRATLEGTVAHLLLPEPTEDERLTLFRGYLKDAPLEPGLTVEELAAKFRFSPRQVARACTMARELARLEGETVLSAELLHRCCYQQVMHRLDELATRVQPAYCWEDLVLPQDQKRLVQRACSHIQHRHTVFSTWGFQQKLPYGRGLSILFAGPPGTGKTMCAQILARQLNMELYQINISQIVSKYIGETEKNLQAVFAEARRCNCVLFFDECDALFGKRSEVKDAHDRNANVEVAYLLQQMEAHDGVCILATNLFGNIDSAFVRRITYVVHFPFPDAAMRQKIYRRTIPRQTPLADDIDWAFLAEKFPLSGGHIKNIIVAAAFQAAMEGKPLGMAQLLRAAVDELRKNEMVVVREELQEYADLLEDGATTEGGGTWSSSH